jgi:hypothetical protein
LLLHFQSVNLFSSINLLLQRQLQHAKTSSATSAVTEHEFLPSKKKHSLQFTNTPLHQGAAKIGSATEISEILFLKTADIKLSRKLQ